MVIEIIAYVAAVVLSLYAGYKCGKEQGLITGFGRGRDYEREYWIKKIPPKEVNRVLNEEYDRLMKLVCMSDEEFEKMIEDDLKGK